jgi:signal transduction histidine kinase
MIDAAQQPPQPGDDVGRGLQWAARGAWLVATGAPLAVGIASGWPLARIAQYMLLTLAALLLLEAYRLPEPWCRLLAAPLWRFLLLFGVVVLGLLAVAGDPFLLPALLCVPFVHAALAYPAARTVAVGALYLGLVPLGLWLAGQREPAALLYPVLAYGALLVLIDAFVRVALSQAHARAHSTALAAALERERDELARLMAENARLAEQARVAATLAERNRLARELHDTIAQGLTATTMQLEAAQRAFERDPQRARARLVRAHELVRTTLDDVRRSVWTLAEPLVDATHLPSELEALTQRFRERSGVPATFHHRGAAPQIDAAAATQLLRVAQEALTNIEKHAGARQVALELRVDEQQVQLAVRDDGCGFDPTTIRSSDGSGFGLVSLRERARLAGATLALESAPGQGTCVTMAIRRPAAAVNGGSDDEQHGTDTDHGG